MLRISAILLLLFACLVFRVENLEFKQIVEEVASSVGYRIGDIIGYNHLKTYNQSNLYQIVCPEIDDGRPVRLAQLKGTHYEVGYAYAALLGPEAVENYHTFLMAQFSQQWQILVLENFLSWQYDTYVGEQIPSEFKDELKGLQHGGRKEHNIHNLRAIFQRTLVVSSYPGNFTNDIAYTLLDQFMRDIVHLNNQKLLNIVQSKLFQCVRMIKKFFNQKRIHCSFFALWGQRTQGGKLLTMRNLDWEANTGMNKFKTLFVWKIKDTIPHVTPGFPGLMGALTGMSKAGITVHQAGLDSLRATQLGFQWTLRLRYIMMYAQNLEQAKKIWEQTNNTLGMNHMIGSANDLITNKPAFAVQTMRNYTAWFYDNDERQQGTKFVDPFTKKQYVAGFAMKQAIFRTNHAYDPKINSYRTALPGVATSTMRRYMVMKDGIQYHEDINKKISDYDAINITAITAHKGGDNAYKCPAPKDQGTNVISAVYVPGSLVMYVAFQYGVNETYRTACCGVYMKINMDRWF